MSTPALVHFDVSGRLPLEGDHHVAAWVFPPSPAGAAGPVPLLCCLPGGTYTKAYWHLEVPGRGGYSFAEHLTAQGMLVVAFDHLNTGESSRYARAVDLTPDVVAAANAAALEDVVDRARRGALIDGLAALDVGPVVGVGHSMGAMLAIYQQSLHAPGPGGFDAVAALGYGTIGPIIDFGESDDGSGVPTYESVMGAARAGAFDGEMMADRTMPGMRHHFYWDDVPPDVIAADDLTNTHLPGVAGYLSVVPFIASDHAGRLRCPVFIGLGERDSTPSHYDEPRAYRASRDVTLFVLPRSAHCHNTAGTRHLLWDRIGRWVRELPSR